MACSDPSQQQPAVLPWKFKDAATKHCSLLLLCTQPAGSSPLLLLLTQKVPAAGSFPVPRARWEPAAELVSHCKVVLAKACTQCDSVPPYCLAFANRLVAVFLLEGLSYTQENAQAPVCAHETVRGAGFQVICLWPASVQTFKL